MGDSAARYSSSNKSALLLWLAVAMAIGAMVTGGMLLAWVF
jgi:hypothetical protein